MDEIERKRLETRKRLRDDFEYWCRTCYRIIDKNGSHVPLILNRAQRLVMKSVYQQMAAGKPIRIIILKGRQQGMSTMVEAWQLWRTSQNKARRAFVLAHVAESSSSLFEQARRGYEALPEIVKPEKKRSNKKELIFGALDSSLTVATAGGKGIGRGSTFQYVHASEVGLWEDGSAEANMNGLLQCVPNVPDSAVFIESTAEGIGNLYHRMWTDAERGANPFDAVFTPWFWQDEYRTDPQPKFKKTPEEIDLVRKYELDDRQLQWRRDKIAISGLDLFNQEYPNTPQDAFLTSGRPVFEPQMIHRMIQEAPLPVKRMGMVEGTFQDDPWGELSLWIPKVDPAGTYYIGADVAEGLKHGDYSVAQVINGSGEQVAVWRGHVIADEFAVILAEIGEMFNTATICVELNNHGLLTASNLAKILNYPSVWTEQTYDRIDQEETVRLGFTQNPKTRTMVLNKLRAHVRDSTLIIKDEVTLREMLNFVISESGKMEAQTGAHDDHVMSLALANHINEGNWTPIHNAPDSYIEAI